MDNSDFKREMNKIETQLNNEIQEVKRMIDRLDFEISFKFSIAMIMALSIVVAVIGHST